MCILNFVFIWETLIVIKNRIAANFKNDEEPWFGLWKETSEHLIIKPSEPENKH